MPLNDLLPVVNALSRVEKLQLIQVVAQQLAADEDRAVAGAISWALHNDYAAAALMSKLLEEEKMKKESQSPADSWVNAIRFGDLAAVEAAIAKGADVNAVSSGQLSPLHIAIEHQRVEIVRRLISAGASVNQDVGDGWTPLVHAIDIESDTAWQAHHEIGHETTELSELLLDSGAVPTARAFELAEKYGNCKAVELLRRCESLRS